MYTPGRVGEEGLAGWWWVTSGTWSVAPIRTVSRKGVYFLGNEIKQTPKEVYHPSTNNTFELDLFIGGQNSQEQSGSLQIVKEIAGSLKNKKSMAHFPSLRNKTDDGPLAVGYSQQQ